jgi:hypothetical protein
LLFLWAVISTVEKNSKLFNDETAGKGTAVCLDEFIALKKTLEEVLRLRYRDAEKMIEKLSHLSIPELIP